MTNLEALKNLYVAMGGTEDDVKDFKLNSEIIDALSDVAVGGYSVSESTETIIAEQSVTTAAIQGYPVPVGVITGDISSIIGGDKLRVTFNNVAYAITARTMGAGVGIGEIDGDDVVFTNYPFFITSIDSDIVMFTEAAGTYTVKVEKISQTVTVTDDFKAAVLKVLEESNA